VSREATPRQSNQDLAIEALQVSVFTVPTDKPEADGTLEWSETTLVVAEPQAAGLSGIGWSYAPRACAIMIEDVLAPVITGRSALDVSGVWTAMVRRCRHAGRPGLVSMAIAAVDIALWDLKAKLLELPLCRLLGEVSADVPIYGSGGFISYDDETLTEQLTGWVHDLGIPRVKIKIGESGGSNPARDLERIGLARKAIGPDAELYVDANGGYTKGEAVRMAHAMEPHDVTWFEEPVSSDDLTGLAEIRQAIAADIAAGEYGYDLVYFQRMCAAGAVDCLQADITRCAGLRPTGGLVHPDQGRPGLGLALKHTAAEPYRVR
jgi:L-alanine-DL-glutamate epimerase-like enolase superfamily enzyme